MAVTAEQEQRALLNMDVAGATGPFPDQSDPPSTLASLRHLLGLYPFEVVPVVPGDDLTNPGGYFVAPTDAKMATSVASELPDGRAWQAKFLKTTYIYALVFGTAAAFNAIRRLIQTLSTELNAYRTNLLIGDWERSVGLPDSRLGTAATTLSERRNQVISRLKKQEIVTLKEFQDLIDENLPNSGIWLSIGRESLRFRYAFRYSFGGFGERDRFVIIVNMPAFSLDQVTWPNLLNWLRDFAQAGTLFFQNIVSDSESYVVITHPTDFTTIYAEEDDFGNPLSIKVHWKQIDKNGTVVNVIDDETLIPSNAVQTLSSLEFSGGTVIATTVGFHSLVDGSQVTISGATEPEYNGVFNVKREDQSKFSYQISGSPASPATGSPSVTYTIPGDIKRSFTDSDSDLIEGMVNPPMLDFT